MRITLATTLGLLLATPLLFQRAPAPGTHALPAASPSGGDVCAVGCAAAPASQLLLSEAEYLDLALRYADEPLEPGSSALEALLFHGADTLGWLDSLGSAGLDEEREAFLRRELERTHVRLSVRVVGSGGIVRVRLDDALAPLGVKQHMTATRVLDLRTPEISGTVRRVGLNHLWTRL